MGALCFLAAMCSIGPVYRGGLVVHRWHMRISARIAGQGMTGQFDM